MTTAVVSDSSCYIATPLADALGIRTVPMHVTLGDWSCEESAIDPTEFYDRLRRTQVRPTTSQPAPGEILQVFESVTADRILAITCGANLSGTHAAARLAAQLSPVAVDLVDSRTISGGLGLIVLAAARALADGATHEEALALARSLSGRTCTTWSGDTVGMLLAGGRLASAVETVPGLPVLVLDTAVRLLCTVDTAEAAVAAQVQQVLAATTVTPCRVTLGHGDAPALADAMEALLTGQPGVLGIDRYVVGPVVGAHAGPGSVTASFLSPSSGR